MKTYTIELDPQDAALLEAFAIWTGQTNEDWIKDAVVSYMDTNLDHVVTEISERVVAPISRKTPK